MLDREREREPPIWLDVGDLVVGGPAYPLLGARPCADVAQLSIVAAGVAYGSVLGHGRGSVAPDRGHVPAAARTAGGGARAPPPPPPHPPRRAGRFRVPGPRP